MTATRSITIIVLLFTLSGLPLLSHAGNTGVILQTGKKNNKVIVLPKQHKSVFFKGTTYHYAQGTYYRRGSSGYIIVKPPPGLTVATLPVGFTALTIGGGYYFFHQGIYYQKIPGGYVVVETPVQKETVRTTEKVSIGDRVIVAVDRLHFRDGPGTDEPVRRILGRGTQMKIKEVGSSWYFVELSDKSTGWVMIRHTKPLAPPPQG